MSEHTKTILTAVLSVAVVAAILIFAPAWKGTEMRSRSASESMAEKIRLGKMSPPAFTDEIRQRLENSSGFEHLVSYTDQGFEPMKLIVKKGETVRFTNNSSGALWVSATGDGGRIYPYTDHKSGCGSSDFDSCGPFRPQDFWEFTFLEKGTWTLANAGDKTKTASVTVQ